MSIHSVSPSLAGAIGAAPTGPRQVTEDTFSEELARTLSSWLETAGAPAGEYQITVRRAEPQTPASRQVLVAYTPVAVETSPAPVAGGDPIAAALAQATANGQVDLSRLAASLGAEIRYQPPQWTGPVTRGDSLRDTWMYLPGGGRINAANLLDSLNRADDPANRFGALSAMVHTANWLGTHQEAGLYSKGGMENA